MKLSYTRADRFTSCRFAFKHDYPQDGTVVPENQSLPLLGGKYFHRIAESWGKAQGYNSSFFDRTGGSRPPTSEEEIVIYDLVSKPPKGLPFEVYDDIKGVFLAWAERTVLEFPDKCRYELVLAFNRKWETVEWDADDVFLRMVIDRVDLIDTPTRIIDYKTTKALQTAKKLQQLTYAFGLNLALGDDHRDFDVGEQYVRFPRVPIKFNTLTYEDYSGIGDYYLGLDAEIEANEDWAPTINSWCGLCAHTGICPKYQDEIAGTDMEVTTMAQAQRLAEKQFVADARSKDVKKILKAFSEVHGVLQFGDQEYGPKISDGVKWDELHDLVVEMEANHGVDAWAFLGLTKSKFEKAIKDKDTRAALIAKFGQPTAEQKFTFHKVPK